jgi:CRP-like cAMP-binding protein
VQRRELGRDGAERLGKIAVLSDLSIGRRSELARLADEIEAQAGEVIIVQGNPGYEFMMLEAGHADVLKDGVQINTMGPGDCFGELAVLSDGATRTASVVASSDLRAVVLTAHFMREMHDRLPSVGERIDHVAAERTERDAGVGGISAADTGASRSAS